MARQYDRRPDIKGSNDADKSPEHVGWIGRALLAALAEAKREMPRQALIAAAFGKDASSVQHRQVTWELTALKESGRVENARRGWWRLADKVESAARDREHQAVIRRVGISTEKARRTLAEAQSRTNANPPPKQNH